MFTSNVFARVIGQYVSTSRNPPPYLSTVPRRSGTLSGSALLAYKINWQSVLFVGYGDDRELSEHHELERFRPSVVREGVVRVPAIAVHASADGDLIARRFWECSRVYGLARCDCRPAHPAVEAATPASESPGDFNFPCGEREQLSCHPVEHAIAPLDGNR